MAQCAFCSTTIIFGGRRLGEHLFCNARCMMQGRAIIVAEGGDNEIWDVISEMREEMLALAEELQEVRTALSEANERVDFAERALVQLRESRADVE